jgi:hypothetical protein
MCSSKLSGPRFQQFGFDVKMRQVKIGRLSCLALALIAA